MAKLGGHKLNQEATRTPEAPAEQKAVRTAASETEMLIGLPTAAEAMPAEDLALFAPSIRGAAGAAGVKNYGPGVDSVLDSKIEVMLRGERVILSDKECAAIAELDAEWTGRFGTLPNPEQVGTLDAWSGFIKTEEQIKGEAAAYDDLTVLMVDADEALRTGDKATAVSKLLAGADLAEKWNLDYRRRYDAAWMRKTAAELSA